MLELVEKHWFVGVVSATIVDEVFKNPAEKFRPDVAESFGPYWARLPLLVVPDVPNLPDTTWQEKINSKDQHVVAAALVTQCTYLVTLDRHLVAEIAGSRLDLHPLTPGEFIREVLPGHPFYRRIRP